MAEPPANSTDLYLFLAQELGLHPASSEKTFVMRDIRSALMTINSQGRKCLVIIDESHLMSEDVLNGIRLLNNLEEGSIKLIQLLLLGQDELMEKINKPEMIPFKQRIAALESLGKMTTDGIIKYITHRIQVAGGNPNLISATGWEAISIAFSTGGTPRTINSLCDRSFNVAYERNKSAIDAKDVYEATQRMGLITDVFHYIIMLNNEERKKQESQDITDKSIQESVAPETASNNERPLSPNIKKAEQSINPIGNEIPVLPRARMDVSDKSYDEIANAIKAKYEQKNLKISVIFLLLSITTFLISIFYFCHRSDADGLLECLTRLFSF
jgi:general secretion pathway protein A